MGGSSSQQHTHQQLVLDEEALKVLDEEALRETTTTTVDEHETGDEYLTEKQQHQLFLDEKALRETLEEEARAEKEWGRELEQEQEEKAERVRHQNYIYRERIEAEERLKADCFGPNPKYPLYYFRKRRLLDFFTMCVIELFMPEYLRKPDFNDIQNLYTAHNNIHGFPGMLGSIDCMHWEWRNCPKAWHGQFARGDKKYPTILLEAVASYDL
ncbi:transcription elongation factor SPT6 [Tanacetum coccineum]